MGKDGRLKETPELSKLHPVASDGSSANLMMCAATASMIRLFSSA